MEIEYKGHKAKTRDEVVWWTIMHPHIGTVYLDSTIVSYKAEMIPLDEEADTIKNIFLKWFKNKVDATSTSV